MIGGLGHRRGIAVAVPSGGLRVKDRLRETEHQPPRAPVRQVAERIEVAFHQLLRFAAEVAVVVLVDKAGRRYLRAARQAPQFLLLLLGQRFVQRLELVVLVLAHT